MPTKITLTIACVVFLIALPLLPAVPVQAAGGILYATTTGSGGCASWATSCSLQTALATATSGDEIWVAAGLYTPGSLRTDTFLLAVNVAVYGGFAGTESIRDLRDPQLNLTILSGDINGDDSQTPIVIDPATVTNNINNSYHVVTGADGSTLDGFTITAGYANGIINPYHVGAGIYNDHTSPTLRDLRIEGNEAESCAGICNLFSDPILTEIVIISNHASIIGGGMYNYVSNPSLTSVSFNSNHAANMGGGMLNEQSSPILNDVTFIENWTVSTVQAYYGGGGLYNFDHSSPRLTDVSFIGNLSPAGAGIHNYSFSSPSLNRVTFYHNHASRSGGGMYDDVDCSSILTDVIFNTNIADSSAGGYFTGTRSAPTLTNVTFMDNSADETGGMLNGDGVHSTLTNVTFNGNTSNDQGGAIGNTQNCSTTLNHVTLLGNSSSQGGGMYNGLCTVDIHNSIFWDNVAPEGSQIYNLNPGYVATISDSVVHFGYPGGTNIVTADPLLGDIGAYGGFTPTLPLLLGSSAINTADTAYCPATDQRGVYRPQGLRCDIGAFEFEIPFMLFLPLILRMP